MQAYCAGIDPVRAGPGTLAVRLALPDGWRCRTRVLVDELVVALTQHVATVL
jgi:hypothetical protein